MNEWTNERREWMKGGWRGYREGRVWCSLVIHWSMKKSITTSYIQLLQKKKKN